MPTQYKVLITIGLTVLAAGLVTLFVPLSVIAFILFRLGLGY